MFTRLHFPRARRNSCPAGVPDALSLLVRQGVFRSPLLWTAALLAGLFGHPLAGTGQTLVYNVDFETSIPLSWSQTRADATSNGFQWGSSIGLSSEFFPIPVHSFFAATNDDQSGCWNGSTDSCSNKSADRLIMPAVDMTVFPSLRLEADVFYINGTYVYSESAAIQVSLDSGQTWSTVRVLSGSAAWQTETVDLSAFAGQPSVTLCFYYNDGGGWLYGLAVDNVRLIEPAAYDVAATALNFSNDYELEGSLEISGSLVNLGATTLTHFDLNYSIDGAAPVVQAVSGVSIDPLEHYSFTHSSPWLAAASPSPQIVEVWASNLNDSLDLVPDNDRLSKGLYIVSPEQTTDRLVVFEHFTSTNSGPSSTQNPAFTAAMQANSSIATYLSYHVWWPFSTDPFYQAFSVGPQERVSYYNNVFAPWVWMDGRDVGGLSNVNSGLIGAQADYPALFDLRGDATFNGSGELTVDVTLTSLAPYWGSDVSVHVAAIEEYYPGPNPDPNANAEDDFRQIVRQMLPDAFGTPVTALSQGASQTVSLTWTPPPGLINPEELALVAFVQDNSSKGILQGAFFRAEVVGLEEALLSSRLSLSPNPAAESSQLTVELEKAMPLCVDLMDITGRVIRSLGCGTFAAGRHQQPIGVSDLATGAYFIRLSNESARQFIQLQVVR
jgi:hypothetical protein